MNRSRTSSSLVASGAAALLQKARGQARGQQFVTGSRGSALSGPQTQMRMAATTGNEDEDDIAAYLSQLSKKTSGAKKERVTADDLSSGLSDLSLSDEQGSNARHAGSSQHLNKFLKKSSKSMVPESKSAILSPSKKADPARVSSAAVHRSTSKFTSSALQKASKLSAKIIARKTGMQDDEDSDSSEDGDRPGAGRGGLASTAVDGTHPNDAHSIGDGNRFLKKSASKNASDSTAQRHPPASQDASGKEEIQGHDQGSSYQRRDTDAVTGRDDSAFMSGRLDGRIEMAMTSTPVKSGEKKAGMKGSVYNRIMAQLDTDEEDMVDLIGGDSSPEPVPIVKKVEKESRRAVTPYKPQEPLSESESSQASMLASAGMTGNKHNQAITVENLEPVALDLSSIQSIPSGEESSISEAMSPSPKLAGLQTIDDLLPRNSPTPRGLVRETPPDAAEVYQYDFESVSERTASPAAALQSPSPRPVLVEETDGSPSWASSVQEVLDRSGRRTVAGSHSEASTRSSRTRSSRSSSRSSRSSARSSRSRTSADSDRDTSWSYSHSASSDRSSSRHTVRSAASSVSRRSSTTAYTEDFDSVSRSSDGTLQDDHTITSDYSTSHSKRHSGSSSQASTYSRRKHRKSEKRHYRRSSQPAGKNAAVQTSSSLQAVDRHWVNDIDFQTPGYFKLLSSHIHETMSHNVDPMLLQTLSSFDPSSLDLHASLSEQVRQTRVALTNTLRQHQAFLQSLEENYEYTTLEDTQRFIKRQKKRRRREEERMQAALKEVDVNIEN